MAFIVCQSTMSAMLWLQVTEYQKKCCLNTRNPGPVGVSQMWQARSHSLWFPWASLLVIHWWSQGNGSPPNSEIFEVGVGAGSVSTMSIIIIVCILMFWHVDSYWPWMHCLSQGWVLKNLPANTGYSGDMGLIPASGRFWPQSMWNLSSLIRDRTHTPCVGRWNLNYCTIREVL